MICNRRYPIDFEKYCQKTGALLAHRIGRILEKIGYHTWISIGQSNGVDLEVYQNGKLIMIAEILNWSIRTRLSQKRKKCIKKTLTNPVYTCNRVLIYTTMKNEKSLQSLSKIGVSILKLEIQILPKGFYNFYAAKNQTTLREPDSKITSEWIKFKLINYLKTINIPKFSSNVKCSPISQPNTVSTNTII